MIHVRIPSLRANPYRAITARVTLVGALLAGAAVLPAHAADRDTRGWDPPADRQERPERAPRRWDFSDQDDYDRPSVVITERTFKRFDRDDRDGCADVVRPGAIRPPPIPIAPGETSPAVSKGGRR